MIFSSAFLNISLVECRLIIVLWDYNLHIFAKSFKLTVKLNISTTKNMTIDEAQSTIDQWIKNYGVRYFSELTNMAILTEEVGEVARIMSRKFGDQSFKPSDVDKDLSEELADVMFVLICIANQTGINLTDALLKNIEKKTHRDEYRHKNNEKLFK